MREKSSILLKFKIFLKAYSIMVGRYLIFPSVEVYVGINFHGIFNLSRQVEQYRALGAALKEY